jgi:hypothetical protein
MVVEDYNPDDVFQSIHISRQKEPLPQKAGEMRAVIATYPPLGQVTCTRHASIVFTVQLEVDASRASDSWQIALWYAENNSTDWKELLLKESSEDQVESLQTHSAADAHVLHFQTSLPTTTSVNFTVKFRNGLDASWKWVRDQQGMQDGIVIPESLKAKTTSEDLHKYIKGMDPRLEIQVERSQTPDTSLWSVTAKVDAADGEKSSFTDIRFGVPWTQFLKYENLHFLSCAPASESLRP